MVKIFEINKLLANVISLTGKETQANKEHVLNRYQNRYFIEQTSDVNDVIEFAEKLDFVKINDDLVSLTCHGKSFSKLVKHNLNPSNEQRQYVENLLPKIPLLCKELQTQFQSFHIDFEHQPPIHRSIKQMPTNFHLLEFFQDVGTIKIDDDGMYVPSEKNYLMSVIKNIEHIKKIDFEELNRKKTEIGKLGEKLAMEYEIDRLFDQQNLREQIKHVSLYDDFAGYDILSYNDLNSDESHHDRMIEVKATVGNEPVFYLSANELDVAAHHKSKYWIYLWTDVLGSNPCIYMIQNPYEKFFVNSENKPEPVAYRVDKNLINNTTVLNKCDIV